MQTLEVWQDYAKLARKAYLLRTSHCSFSCNYLLWRITLLLGVDLNATETIWDDLTVYIEKIYPKVHPSYKLQ